MLAATGTPPEGSGAIAAALAADRVGWKGLDIATKPIAVHCLRTAAGSDQWDSALPLVAWAYPAFRDGALVCMVAVDLDGAEMPLNTAEAEGLERALAGGVGMAWSAGGGILRMVAVPNGPAMFWVDWGSDSFVCAQTGRVIAGPHFASEAREAAGMWCDGETDVS